MKHNLRRDAKAILMAALAAADPTSAVEKVLRARDDFHRYENIFVVGAGKAAGTMARTVEQFLSGRVSAGCVNVKDGDTARTRLIELRPCGHPVPDERGLQGAKRIAEICTGAGENDLVICLLSGGASALTPFPAPPITLTEKQETTRLLLASGADIHEINAVRKHLSAIKGGQLARLAAPAHVLSLILSDVVGDDLDAIGSGPTAPDASTFQDAFAVLEKYELRDRVPKRVRERLKTGARETPKAGDPLFENVENIIVGNNQKSLESAARAAKDMGYRTLILSSTIEGETRDIARMHAAIARQIRTHAQPVRPPVCVISGGETTVTMRNGSEGRGGRNQGVRARGCDRGRRTRQTFSFSAQARMVSTAPRMLLAPWPTAPPWLAGIQRRRCARKPRRLPAFRGTGRSGYHRFYRNERHGPALDTGFAN